MPGDNQHATKARFEFTKKFKFAGQVEFAEQVTFAKQFEKKFEFSKQVTRTEIWQGSEQNRS